MFVASFPIALHLAVLLFSFSLLFLFCPMLTESLSIHTYVHIIPLYIWDTYSLLVASRNIRTVIMLNML